MTDLATRYPDAQHFTFGDSHELCEELLALVISGAKTATCMPLRDVAEGREPMPEIGRRDIATDWAGTPRVVIETTEVTLRPFNQVEADFALAEGENDSLAGWQRDHQRYFERTGGFTPGMMLVCERFRVVELL